MIATFNKEKGVTYSGSKVLLALAISAAIQSQAGAEAFNLESVLQRPVLGDGYTRLTGYSGYGVSIGSTNQLTVDAHLASLNNSGLSIAELSGNNPVLTINNTVNGQVGVDIESGSGQIVLNDGADVQGQNWALSANGGQYDLLMNGGRIAGNVEGIDLFEVRAQGSKGAVITAGKLDVGHLHIKNGELTFQQQGTEISGNLTVDTGAGIDLQINEATMLDVALLNVRGNVIFAKDSHINLNTPSSQFVTQDTQYTLVKAEELTDDGVDIRSSLSPFLQLKDVHVYDDSSLMATIGLVGAGEGNEGGGSGGDAGNGSDTGTGGGDTGNGSEAGNSGGNTDNGSGNEAGGGEAGNGSEGGSGNNGSGNAQQDLNDLAERLAQQGASHNGINAAQSFVSVLAQLGNDNALYQRFLDARDGDLNGLLEQLTPETSGAVVNAAMSASGLTGAALSARATSVGANSGEMLKETGVWVQVLHGDATQSRRNGVAGYDADSKGLVVGADGKVNDALTLGVALSLVNTDVNGAVGSDTEVDTQLLSAYGRYENGPWGLTGSLSYGQSQNDSKRAIAHEVAKASYDSNLLAAELELGYRTEVGSLVVEPVTALRYSNVSVDSFKEKGSSAALANNSQRFEVFDLGVGFNLSAQVGEFTPTARLMAYHDFAQDTVKSTSSFILGGNSFVTTGADATKWTYEAGLGLDWSRGQYSVGVGYDYIRKADFNADTFSLKARYDF